MARRPFHYQQKDYWCGPAVLQTVLASHGQRHSQSSLARLLQTTKRSGTKRGRLAAVARRLGLQATVQRTATVATVKRVLGRRRLVIVNYVEPNGEGHYALVGRVSETHVFLDDPWHGRHLRIDWKTFMSNWSKRQRWLMAVVVK